jgi:hypothetical protein
MEFISYLLGWFSGLFVGIAIGDYFVQEIKNRRLQKLYEIVFSPTMINVLYDYIKVVYPDIVNFNIGVRPRGANNTHNVPNFNNFNFCTSPRGTNNTTEPNTNNTTEPNTTEPNTTEPNTNNTTEPNTNNVAKSIKTQDPYTESKPNTY